MGETGAFRFREGGNSEAGEDDEAAEAVDFLRLKSDGMWESTRAGGGEKETIRGPKRLECKRWGEFGPSRRCNQRKENPACGLWGGREKYGK